MPNFGLVNSSPSYVCDMYVSLGEGRRHPGLSPALLMFSVGSASPVGLGLRLGGPRVSEPRVQVCLLKALPRGPWLLLPLADNHLRLRRKYLSASTRSCNPLLT